MLPPQNVLVRDAHWAPLLPFVPGPKERQHPRCQSASSIVNVSSPCAPRRSWGVFTRRVRTIKHGRNRTPQSTRPGCTRSRTPCPWWTRPSCRSRGRTRWKTWTREPRTSSRTAARTAVKLHQDRMDLKQIHSDLRLFYSFFVKEKQQW